MDHERAYRLFGDLYLDSPNSKPFLLPVLQRLEPYLRDLEHRHASGDVSEWNCEDAFKSAARAEVAGWKTRGLRRDIRFLIPPDGPLDAPLSCHLHNPNFNISNPYSSCAADGSNLSVHQVMSAGFTPDKVLIYDHTFRREPVDGIEAYPPEILRIHESFTNDLRRNMAAVVDVVWGAPVRERVKKTHKLEELQLWGKYSGVSIFLEWEVNGPRLVRFVVFVCHPEAMVYGEPETLGKKQDLQLQVAAKLAKVRIRENFYERIYRPRDHKFLSGKELARRNALNKEAIEQLESVAYRHKALTDSAQQRRSRVPLLERKRLRQYPGLNEYFDKQDDEESASLSKDLDTTDASEAEQCGLTSSFHIDPEIDKEFIRPIWLKMLASSLANDDSGNTTIADAMQLCNALADGEFDLAGPTRWEDLPHQLRIWLQRQDGLQVDGRPITSIRELLEVHGLIAKKPPISEGDRKVSITDIVLQVIARYYHLLACSARDSNIQHLTVRGTSPMPLKCSHCKSRLLDDPFPRFKKTDQERYVAHNLKRGCGSKTCQEDRRHCLAVSWNSSIPWAAPKAIVLERPVMKADWTDLLLLQKEKAAHLPRGVQIICRACKDPSSIRTDDEPRWTIKPRSRYVARKPRCTVCRKNGTTWCPVDSSISWLDQANISKMWKKKDKKNWDLDDMVKNPSDYFPKRQEETRAARRKRTKRRIKYQV